MITVFPQRNPTHRHTAGVRFVLDARGSPVFAFLSLEVLVLPALERLGHDTLRCDDVDHASPPAERVAIYRRQEALRHRLEQLVLVLESRTEEKSHRHKTQ